MSLKAEDFARTVCLTAAEAERYLRGETLPGGGKGWCGVLVEGYPLGWVKAAGGVVKNHYPKGRRLVK